MGPREVCSRWMAAHAAIHLVIIAIPGCRAAAGLVSAGDWVSTVQTLGPLSDRFTVQETAPTDVGSIDIAADGSAV